MLCHELDPDFQDFIAVAGVDQERIFFGWCLAVEVGHGAADKQVLKG